jgi:hypothetical protein
MSAIDLPRFEDDFRAAFDLKVGFVEQCREALSRDSRIVDFERIRRALSERGREGVGGGIPALTAAEDLRRVVQTLREDRRVPSAGELWRVPVAAGVDQQPGGLDPRSVDERARAGWLDLLGRWLNGAFPDEALDIEMPVLTRLGSKGEVGTLRLRALADGPPGLYPHPSMALFYGDPLFRAGVADAWEAVAVGRGTFTWELRIGDRAVDHLAGASAGGAFAVALTHLVHRRTGKLARALGVRSHAAVSAEVRADGSLESVKGRDKKLEAAAASKLRLVVLASEDEVAGRDGGRARPRVRFAADVREAVKLTRGRVSLLASAVAALLVVAALSVAVLVVQNHRSDVRNKRERLARMADDALSKAMSVGSDDLELQLKLLLASTALARGADDRALAERALSRGARLDHGVLERLELPLGGSVDGLVPVDDGQGVIAWSHTGHLALFDAATGRLRGSFVQPPGISSLIQEIPVASSTLAGTGLAAFVFQNPIAYPEADPRATLVIFSTAGPLRVIGTVRNFASAPTTAVGYAPSGTRLLTVSGSSLTVWDVTAATPTALGTCRWRPSGSEARGRAVGILPIDGGRPGLVLDRGQVVRLDGWEPTSRPSCRGRLVAPALPGVPPYDFTNDTLAAGRSSQGRTVQLGVRRDGRMAVRELGRTETVLDVGPRVKGVGTPLAGQVPVQTVERGASSLRVLDLGKRGLEPSNRYRHHRLPAVVSAERTYASRRGQVSRLSASRQVYPVATAELGHGYIAGVAMTGHAVALASPNHVAVFGLRDRRLDRVVTWPKGFTLAGGDGRLNGAFSLSSSGRYVAAAVSTSGGERRLALYDAAHHAQIDVRRQLREFTPFAPLDVAFERGGDRLLIEYLNGLLVRLSPTASGWTAEALLRGQVGLQAFGLRLTDGAIFRIEVKAGKARVARYDLDGALEATWSLAATRAIFGLTAEATLAQIAAMGDSRAALVLGTGTAFELLDGGDLGPPVPLGEGPILDTVQIGPDELLVARRSGTSTLNWRNWVAEESTERYGLVNAVAASPEFDFLAGAVWLTAQAIVTPLRDDVRTALLCDSADGDLSRAQWRHFVGADVEYRPLCGAFRSQGRAAEDLALRSQQLAEPIGLSTPTVAQASSLQRACAARGEAPLAWTWAPAGADASPVLCVHGRAAWLASGIERPRVVAGGSPRHPLLLVGGPAKDDPAPRANVSELVDASGNVVAKFVTKGGAAGLVGNRVLVTDRVGDLLFTTTYVRDPRGAGWIPRQQLPAGTIEPPGDS